MYGYGYRYNNGLVVGSGAPTPPPFANTRSLSFDGVDDYLSVGATFDATNGVSFSCWVKYDGVGAGLNWLCSGGSISGVDSQFNTRLIPDGRWFNYFQGSASNTGITGLNDGNWHNLIQTVNYSNGDVKFYKDGAVSATVLTFGSTYSTAKLGVIGGATSAPIYPFKGLVDEFAIFESVLTPAEIVTLSTAPTVDLTSLNPVAWYRMGDNGSYKSPQWLIPSNENKDKVSNYSYEFQGINSRQIDVGTVNVGTTNITSMWLKRNVVSTQQTLLGGSSATSPTYHMLIFTGNDFYVRYSPTVFVGWTLSNVTTILNDTINWINIVVVRTGDTVKLHLNGDNVGIVPDSFGGGAIGALGTQFTDIGADINGTFPVNGIVNNIAAWNVDTVLPSDIYNGGTPPDLTTLPTAPVNWWKMGEDATLVYTVNPFGAWNIPDSVGSNDGTTNTTSSIFARIGEAPNSTNNALSINMDFVDVVLDTPPTP
jgi:hypothetical protein